MGKQIQMIDTCTIADTFVSGMGEVEPLGGGMYRFTFYALDHGEAVVSAKLVASEQALREAMTLAAKAAGICACQKVRGMAVN